MPSALVAGRNTPKVDWALAFLAGIVAMIVFAIIEIAFSWAMRGASPMQPLVVYGTATLNAVMPTAHVGGGIKTAIAGAACLLVLGAVSGIILAYIVDRIGMVPAAIAGALFGLAMYAIDLYAIGRVLASLVDLRDWMSALAYVIQGALTAALYKVMTREEALPPGSAERHDLRDLHNVRLV
jgi:hypothetical protein